MGTGPPDSPVTGTRLPMLRDATGQPLRIRFETEQNGKPEKRMGCGMAGGKGRIWGKHRFYNRLFFFNALVSLIILIVFATVASRLSFQVEMNRLQQQNREVLAAVCSYYNTKHDEYVNMVYALYDIRSNYLMLTDLLENTGTPAFEADPFSRREITDFMKRLVARDEDVEAVYLYSNAAARQFVFQKRFNTFGQVPGEDVYTERLKKNVIGRVPLGVRIQSVPNLSGMMRTYGIASSVGTLNTRTNAGKLVIAYNEEPLRRVWQRYARGMTGQCLILSDEGEVIFNSSGQYDASHYTQMALSGANEETIEVEGEKSYILTLPNPARKYTGLMVVPVKAYTKQASMTSYLIYASCAGFALLSILLYFLAGWRVSRRVTELESAMEKVGSHNLSYRIVLRGNEDEYEHIARFFNKMCDDLQENIDRMYLYELKQKSAELGALQARINPHFLYNSLEAVRAKVLADGNEEASDMIAQLAGIFRGILKGKAICTVRQEMEFLRMYLNLFSFRHGGNLEVVMAVDANVLELGMIKYLMQPVVENYFVHGYDQERLDNRLTFHGYRDGEVLVLNVCDNGRGITPERLMEIRDRLDTPIDETDASYGLANVNERIRLVFGSEFGLSLESEPGVFTKISLRLKALRCDDLEKILTPLSSTL